MKRSIFKLKPVSIAMKSALFATAGLLAFNTNVAFAAEEEADEEDNKIVITGSRISRSDAETALPVTVITREELDRTGDISVAEVLRDLPYATTGSFFGSGGNSASNHANTDLRGIGGGRTLYLVDGVRIAGGATAGASEANANLIPMVAVEEIHVLREGASSIYGSDAIGGVINIITRKDYEGANLTIHRGEPSQGGGEEQETRLTFGFSGEKTSGIIALSHGTYGGIKGGEREHLRNASDDPYNGYATSVIGPYGLWRAEEFDPSNTAWSIAGRWNPGPNCPEEWIEVIGDRTNSDWCNYPIYEGKDFFPSYATDTLFLNVTREINSDMSVWLRANYNSQDSNVESTDYWHGFAYMAPDNVFNPTFGTPDQQWIGYYHLLTDVAPRVYKYDSTAKSVVTGFDWATEMGDFQAYFSQSENRTDIRGEYYTFVDRLTELVDNEIYNPFMPGGGPLVTQEHLDSFLHTNYRVAKSKTKSFGMSWSSDTEIELGGGTLSYVVGYESHDEQFSDIQDKQTNAGNVGGAFGGDSGGARDYSAYFAEVELPLLDELTLNLATRNDSYSLPNKDAQTSSAKIAYRPIEDRLIRASYSEGFRAPSLDNLLAGAAVSFDEVFDPVCAGQDDCNSQQVERQSSGNPNLSPEESVQTSFGIVYSPIENLTFAIDYYNIEIENQVSYIGAQSVLNLDLRGQLGPFTEAGCGIQYNGTGTTFDDIDVINACYGNSDGYNTSGIDFDVTYRMDLADMGDMTFQLIGSKVNEWSFKENPEAPRYDWVGFTGTPELRYTFNTGWSYDALYLGLSYNHVKGFQGERPDVDYLEDIGDFDAFNTWDLNLSYNLEEYGRVAFGARNLTDEMPTLDRDNILFPGYDEANHDIHGRVVYASYSIDF